MFFNVLFTNLPELFYTINIIPGIKFGLISLAFTSGIILIFVCLTAAIFFYFNKKISYRFDSLALFLFFLAWLPVYTNFLYNNIYDLTENLNYIKYSAVNKKVVRLCNLDNRQDLGGFYCRLFSFLNYVKKNIPTNSSVQVLTVPDIKPYFNYYLYPDFKISDQADYIIFYYPDDYVYINNFLFKKEDGKNIPLGKHDPQSLRNAGELILKK